MDVFDIHQQVIDDYRAFASGFVEVRDDRISGHQGSGRIAPSRRLRMQRVKTY